MVSPASMLATLPNYTPLWVIGSRPILLRNDVSAHGIRSACPHVSSITCLLTPPCRWFLPFFFMSSLQWFWHCASPNFIGEDSWGPLWMGKELSSESWGKSRNNVKDSHQVNKGKTNQKGKRRRKKKSITASFIHQPPNIDWACKEINTSRVCQKRSSKT